MPREEGAGAASSCLDLSLFQADARHSGV